MLKRTAVLMLLIVSLVILMVGQAVAAPAPVAVSRNGIYDLKLELIGEKEAVAIAKQQVAARTTVESVRLVIFKSTVAWEVNLRQEGRWGATLHQIMVHIVSGKVLEHKVTEPSAPKPQRVDREKAIEIAKREAAREVEVRATAHMKNSRLWVVNLSQKDAGKERIYVVIEEDTGRIIERGRIMDGKVEVAQVSPEKAQAIATAKVRYPAQVLSMGLALDKNTLVWEIRLGRSGIGIPNTDRFLISAFDGRILAQESAS